MYSSGARQGTGEPKERQREINYIQYEQSDNEEDNSFEQENYEGVDINSSAQTDFPRVTRVIDHTKGPEEKIR